MPVISTATDIGRGSKKQNKPIPLNSKCHKSKSKSFLAVFKSAVLNKRKIYEKQAFLSKIDY